MTTRWGIAGTGGMAQAFISDFAYVPDAEVVAIGSRTAERAAAFADRHDVAAALTYADVLTADIDVLYIATPHPQHHDLALAAVRAGVPVLVEKSFTATLAGARRVVDAAREAEVFCMEAMWTRVQPAVLRAREMVAAGEIGDLLWVEADFGAYRAYDPTSRLFDPALGGGAVLDLGVYVVSLAQHFLGTPDRVAATGTLFPNGTDASAVIMMSHDDGRAAAVTCSLSSSTPQRAVLAGTGGSIEIEPPFYHPTRLVVRRNGSPAVETIDLPATGRGYAHQIAHVGECLAAGLTESPVVPLADTLDVQWVMEEALSQLGVVAPAEGVVEL
ncbi:MAG TPA: Gfo/Idh/MocA family oxidoreductase [Nocardioides sp.]|nr:Gfo/Idh/MocA family oxidoreductase [Nocardioides sp.]